MTKADYIISDYCIIRNDRVVSNGTLLYDGSGDSPADFFSELYRYFNISYAKFFKMDNLCKLGFLASELMLRDKRPADLNDEVGIILANAGSSIESDRNHMRSIADRDGYFPSPSVFVYTLANIVIGEISIRHKLHGESIFFIDRKFNPEFMHTYVRQLLDEEIISRCIMGWVEMDGEHYEAVLYFIQKSAELKDGIAIFEPEKLHDIYSQRT